MANEQSEYLGLSALQGSNPEPPPTPAQSKDFSTFKTITPGNYTSQSREITFTRRNDGHYSFRISFTGGLINENGRALMVKYPLVKSGVTTVAFKEKDSEGNEYPGTTSAIARYLAACGLTASDNFDTLVNQVIESQSIPVQVFVSRTDKATKDAQGNWVNKGLKLQDFNAGTKEHPVWLENVTVDGVTYSAKPIVSSFRRI